MGFGNKINSFEDDELKARKLKVEITTLEKKLDSYNEMVKTSKSIEGEIVLVEKELDKKNKELDELKEKNKEEVEKQQQELKELSDKKVDINKKNIEGAKIIVEKLEVSKGLDGEIAKKKKDLVKINEVIDANKGIKLSQEKELNDQKVHVDNIADYSKKRNDELIVLEKRCDDAREELGEIEAIQESTLKTFNDKLDSLKDKKKKGEDAVNELLEKENELISITAKKEKELEKLEASFDAKKLELDQRLGEISMREVELESAKNYMRSTIKSLSEIDPKRLSRIDLSKI